MKLISMTDFVLREQNRLIQASNARLKEFSSQYLDRIFNYANFLKQSLKLEMFVPCDEDGDTLQEPEEFKEWMNSDHYFNASESITHQCRMYKKALEKVLFDGFILHEKRSSSEYYFLLQDGIYCFTVKKEKSNKTIENLIGNEIIKLTDSATKQFLTK